jgi:hypothetical protein
VEHSENFLYLVPCSTSASLERLGECSNCTYQKEKSNVASNESNANGLAVKMLFLPLHKEMPNVRERTRQKYPGVQEMLTEVFKV